MQLPSSTVHSVSNHSVSSQSSTPVEHVHQGAAGEEVMNRTVGLVAVFAACMLSGLAGVYFEKVLKGTNASIWVRNVQLSSFSLLPALFGVFWKDGNEVLEKVSLIFLEPVALTARDFSMDII